MPRTIFTWQDPSKRTIYTLIAIWVGTYALRAVLYAIYGADFHFNSFNVFIVWVNGLLLATFVSKIVIYRNKHSGNFLKGLKMTPDEVISIVYGKNEDVEYVDDVLVETVKGISTRRHIFCDRAEGKLYALTYRVGLDNQIIDGVNVAPAREQQKLVTVYEDV